MVESVILTNIHGHAFEPSDVHHLTKFMFMHRAIFENDKISAIVFGHGRMVLSMDQSGSDLA
jgi:hypothetical protein